MAAGLVIPAGATSELVHRLPARHREHALGVPGRAEPGGLGVGAAADPVQRVGGFRLAARAAREELPVLVVFGRDRRRLAVALRWADADLDGGVLVITRNLVELDGYLVEGEPKTQAGTRRVFLDDETARLLREHRQAQRKARLRAGADWQHHDLVFARFNGTPWRPSFVSRPFKALAAQAGVPVVTLHEGGRHTANSLMYDAGVREDIVLRAIGHTSREVNARYNHPLEQAHRAAAEQVAALVRKAGKGS